MNLAPLARYRVQWQVILWRHASAGTGLLVLLLGALGVLVGMTNWTRVELDQMQSALARAKTSEPPASSASPRLEEAAHVALIREQLSRSTTHDSVVGDMAALASRNGIDWVRGEYRLRSHTETRLDQWQVTQPLQTSYSQLRSFIDAVLRTHPNVSLDQIALERDDATGSPLKARLQWSIWIAQAARPNP